MRAFSIGTSTVPVGVDTAKQVSMSFPVLRRARPEGLFLAKVKFSQKKMSTSGPLHPPHIFCKTNTASTDGPRTMSVKKTERESSLTTPDFWKGLPEVNSLCQTAVFKSQ